MRATNANIKEGGYAVLVELTGLDDWRNDDQVEVRLLSAAGAVELDATGGVVRHASMPVHPDARYQGQRTSGRIAEGVLTTDPVDLRLKVKQQTLDNEYWFRDARIRADLLPDGSLRGLLAGYWDSDNLFSVMNDQYIGENHVGRAAANSRGFMCSGMYHALPRVADGHPDPETGICTSVSMAIHFEAVPAFVIEPQVAQVSPAVR